MIKQDRKAKNNLLHAFVILSHSAPLYQVLGTTFSNPRHRIRVLQTSYIQLNKLHCKRCTQVASAGVESQAARSATVWGT